MTTFADQVVRTLAIARGRAEQTSDPWAAQLIYSRAREVYTAWNANPRGIMAEAGQCQDWATGRTGWDRARFGSFCTTWASELEESLDRLADALAAAGHPLAAEAAEALGEQATALAERGADAMPDSADDFELPWWTYPLGLVIVARLLGWRLGG